MAKTLRRAVHAETPLCGRGPFIPYRTNLPSRVTCKTCLRAMKARGEEGRFRLIERINRAFGARARGGLVLRMSSATLRTLTDPMLLSPTEKLGTLKAGAATIEIDERIRSGSFKIGR